MVLESALSQAVDSEARRQGSDLVMDQVVESEHSDRATEKALEPGLGQDPSEVLGLDLALELARASGLGPVLVLALVLASVLALVLAQALVPDDRLDRPVQFWVAVRRVAFRPAAYSSSLASCRSEVPVYLLLQRRPDLADRRSVSSHCKCSLCVSAFLRFRISRK